MTLERTPPSPPEESVKISTAAEGQQVGHDGSPAPTTGDSPRLQKLTIVVLVVGLVVTGVLTASSRLNYLHDEQRLSNLQTNLTASALGIAPVDLERRLGQTAAAAGEAPNPVATFRQVIAPSMAPAGPFASASLALVRNGQVHVLVHTGAVPIKSPTGKTATALFDQAASSGSLITARVEGKGLQRFAYLMPFVGSSGTYVASAGEALPSSRRLVIPPSSPDAGLNVAIYFGKTTSSAAAYRDQCLAPAAHRDRLHGRRALRIQRPDACGLTDEPVGWDSGRSSFPGAFLSSAYYSLPVSPQ